MKKTVTFITDEEEKTVSFPAKWVVCYDCDGRGTTYLGWASKDQPAFTQEDFAQEGPGFREAYMSGDYDKQCPRCKGRTTVLEIFNRDSIHEDLLADYDAWQEHLKEEAEYQAICDAERRMGC